VSALDSGLAKVLSPIHQGYPWSGLAWEGDLVQVDLDGVSFEEPSFFGPGRESGAGMKAP
jgi:hypothetical protein